MIIIGYGAKDLLQTERIVMRQTPSLVELRIWRLLMVAPYWGSRSRKSRKEWTMQFGRVQDRASV